MNDPFGSSHVDALDGGTKAFFTLWGASFVGSSTNTCLQLALDGLVTDFCFCVGKNALLLALDVCHE